MKLFKLIKYDLKNGIIQKLYLYAVTLIMAFAITLAFRMLTEVYNPTITNLLFYLFGGKEPINKELDNAFIFPIVWLIIYIFGAYVTLEYPFDNMVGHGLSVIVRIKKRSFWWLSKCIYTISGTLLYFAMWYLGTVMVSLISGVEISSSYSEEVNAKYIGIEFIKQLSDSDVIMTTLILPVLTGIAFNMLMLCMELFLDRLYCFWIIVFYIFAATYFKAPFLIGNFAMMKKSIFAIEDGYPLMMEIIMETVVIVACIAIGLIRIEKYDILSKEN